MIEYPLDEYKDYEFLKFNLLNEEDEKEEKKIPYSTKREDLISQMLIDYYKLDINKDDRFVNRRELYFYEIIIFLNEKEIKKVDFLKTKRHMELFFDIEINKAIFKYKIEVSKKNTQAFRIIDKTTTSQKKEEALNENQDNNLKPLSIIRTNSGSSSKKGNIRTNDEEFSTDQSKKAKKITLKKISR